MVSPSLGFPLLAPWQAYSEPFPCTQAWPPWLPARGPALSAILMLFSFQGPRETADPLRKAALGPVSRHRRHLSLLSLADTDKP